MINENELRQGNYVLEGGSFKKIDYRDSDWFHVDLFEPVQITDEILEKCDFSKYRFHCTLSSNHYTKIKLPCNNGERAMLRNIRYLHQLQNLYFAYFLEELPVNL